MFLLLTGSALSQSVLQVSISRANRTKIFEVFNREVLEYKLKGDIVFSKQRIVNMQDSVIVFDNDSVIKIDQIKALRLNRNIAEVTALKKFFIGLGIAFFVLNTANNAINDSPPLIDGVAAGISGGLIATGFLIKQLGIKRIKLNRNKTLRIIAMNYNQKK